MNPESSCQTETEHDTKELRSSLSLRFSKKQVSEIRGPPLFIWNSASCQEVLVSQPLCALSNGSITFSSASNIGSIRFGLAIASLRVDRILIRHRTVRRSNSFLSASMPFKVLLRKFSFSVPQSRHFPLQPRLDYNIYVRSDHTHSEIDEKRLPF